MSEVHSGTVKCRAFTESQVGRLASQTPGTALSFGVIPPHSPEQVQQQVLPHGL